MFTASPPESVPSKSKSVSAPRVAAPTRSRRASCPGAIAVAGASSCPRYSAPGRRSTSCISKPGGARAVPCWPRCAARRWAARTSPRPWPPPTRSPCCAWPDAGPGRTGPGPDCRSVGLLDYRGRGPALPRPGLGHPPRFPRLDDNDREGLVTRAEFPALFALTDRIARTLDARPVEAIVLCEDFNAAMGLSAGAAGPCSLSACPCSPSSTTPSA